MEAFYILLFAAIAATTVFFEIGKGRGSSSASSSSSLTRDFAAFRNNYVLVYALMMGKRGRWTVFSIAASSRWKAEDSVSRDGWRQRLEQRERAKGAADRRSILGGEARRGSIDGLDRTKPLLSLFRRLSRPLSSLISPRRPQKARGNSLLDRNRAKNRLPRGRKSFPRDVLDAHLARRGKEKKRRGEIQKTKTTNDERRRSP